MGQTNLTADPVEADSEAEGQMDLMLVAVVSAVDAAVNEEEAVSVVLATYDPCYVLKLALIQEHLAVLVEKTIFPSFHLSQAQILLY